MTVATTTDIECPNCGKKGKTVTLLTLRALLKDEFAGQIADADYRFCDAKDCNIVYFGNGRTFPKSQLNVAVGVKETQGERPLCYCFGHSVATLKEEIRTKGRSDALQDIRKKLKDAGCACEVTNPSGTCCLGTVTKGIETAKSELLGTCPTGGKAETISKVGTVLSAIMASSCCWLPLLLLAFGVSGAGIAGTLDAYRPLFIALTAVCLTAAFYFTYRPRRIAQDSTDCCTTVNACCATPTTGLQFGATTLNKVMLWGVTILAIAFLSFPNYVKDFLTVGDSDKPALSTPLVRTTTFAVKGMSCEGCAAVVEKVVKDIPGVLSVRVDYDKKTVEISTEACCPAPVDPVVQALEKAGYQGEVVSDSPPKAVQ
jgi:copper chaperone CopZ